MQRGCGAADRNAGCALPPNPHITMEASGITMPEDNEASNKARRISHIMRQVRKRATVSSADTREEGVRRDLATRLTRAATLYIGQGV